MSQPLTINFESSILETVDATITKNFEEVSSTKLSYFRDPTDPNGWTMAMQTMMIYFTMEQDAGE